MPDSTHEQINAALAQLDVDDDAQWTNKGAPKMEAVEAVLGENITRDDLNAAAPNYTRESARDIAAMNNGSNDPNAGANGSGTGADSTPTDASPDGQGAPDDSQQPESDDESDDDESEGEIDANDKAAAVKLVAEKLEAVGAARAEHADAVAALDVIIAAEEQAGKTDHTSQANNVKAYQRAQMAARRAEVAKQAALAKFLQGQGS